MTDLSFISIRIETEFRSLCNEHLCLSVCMISTDGVTSQRVQGPVERYLLLLTQEMLKIFSEILFSFCGYLRN